jgi:type III secretion protein F
MEGVSAAMADLMKLVAQSGADMKKDITDASNYVDPNTQKHELSQEQLLNIQFNMGQYNAMLEAASSISKSVTDMAKTLAQRSS